MLSMTSAMINGELTLKHIQVEFPEYELEIAERYHECAGFIELCEDYVLCLDSVRKIERGNAAGYETELIPLKEALSDLCLSGSI